VGIALGVLISVVSMTTPIVTFPSPEPIPAEYGPGARVVLVRAPHATLRLFLATRVGEGVALLCVKELPTHGGMLLSVSNANRPTLFAPRYQFAHVDEIALDSSGTVVAGVLDMPQFTLRSSGHFLVRARYLIDVPAGEALADGLVPGEKVSIEADEETLTAEPPTGCRERRFVPPDPF
jgi:uncharacterized membrane protein (UPF0127 family)